MAINNQPRNYQTWVNINATPNDFNLDAGAYALTLHATTWGTGAVLQKLIDASPANGGALYVNVGLPITGDNFAEFHVPAGQYRLQLTGVAGLYGEIARIGPWAGR